MVLGQATAVVGQLMSVMGSLTATVGETTAIVNWKTGKTKLLRLKKKHGAVFPMQPFWSACKNDLK